MKRRGTIGLGLAAVVLIGAAFVGGRLLTRPTNSTSIFGGPSFIGRERAKDLPAETAALIGIFDHRADNSLFVGTHVTKFERRRECDTCPVQRNIAYDGPVVEVVATRDTIIYRNATNFDGPIVGDKIQEIVAPGTLDDIGSQALVEVWGERQGDRLVARVVLYSYLP
jgi:hypothetical protein